MEISKEEIQTSNYPKCAIEGCKGKALVHMGGQYICGNCYVKWEKKQQAIILESIKDAYQDM